MWKKIAFSGIFGALLLTCASQSAWAQQEGAGSPNVSFLVGPQAELSFIRGPNYPTDTKDYKSGLLLGLYAGTSGLELIPSILISEGQYKAFLLDAGVRVTPKWFGQEEYLFNLIAPYVVLGGSVGYPWSGGWHIKAGLGFALMQFGSLNAEIGYRAHTFDANNRIDSVTIALRGTYPF